MSIVTRTLPAVVLALAFVLAAGVARSCDVRLDRARTTSSADRRSKAHHPPLDDSNALFRNALAKARTATSTTPQVDGVPAGGPRDPIVLTAGDGARARASRMHFRPAHLQNVPLLI